MEKRGYFVDAQRFYEWTQKHTDDQDLKKEMLIRWIACKERQAKDKGDAGSEHWREADEKRTELGLTDNFEIPQEAKFFRWQWLFNEVLTLPAAKKEKKAKEVAKTQLPENPKPKTEFAPLPTTIEPPILPGESFPGALPIPGIQLPDSQKKLIEQALGQSLLPESNKLVKDILQSIDAKGTKEKSTEKQISVPVPEKVTPTDDTKGNKPNAIFKYNVLGYKFNYNPGKSELSINFESDEEDLRVKIKHGKFPADAEFVLVDTQLIKAYNNQETPFEITINDIEIRIIIKESQMSMVFPI